MDRLEKYKCPVCGWVPTDKDPDCYWEHCPNCLCEIHNKDSEGVECGGVLEPVSIWVKSNGKLEIIQRCRMCGEMRTVPQHYCDNPVKLLAVASRVLSEPPFPIDKLEELTKITGTSGDIGGYYDEPRKQEKNV